MANFPTSLDSLSNPGANDTLAAVPHHTQHGTINDIGEALEAKVGIGASTPVAGRQLRGTGTGTSKWTGIKQVVIESTGGAMSTIINAAIQEQTGACELLFPDETYLIDAQLLIDRDNIFLRGNGGPTVPSGTGRTWFFVSANIAGPAILFDKDPGGTAEAGPTTDEVVSGGGLSHIHLDGNDTTGDGIGIVTARSLYFHDFSVNRFDGNAIEFGNHGTAPGGADTYDNNTGLRFERFTIAQSTGTGLYIDDNTYSCSFTDFGITVTGAGTGMDLYLSDDLWFSNWSVLCQDAGGTNVVLHGQDNGVATAGGIKSSVFGPGYINGSAKVIRCHGDGFDSTAWRNLFLPIGTEDGPPTFTADLGAMPSFLTTEGRHNFRQDIASTAIVQDEFMAGGTTTGAIGDLGWFLSAGTASLVTATTAHPGAVRISTGGSSGTHAILSLRSDASTGLLHPTTSFDAYFIVDPQVTDSDTQFRVGFMKSVLADPGDDGFYFEKLVGDVKWWAVCRASGTETRTIFNTDVATGWVRLRIRRHNDESIGFTIGSDGVNGRSGKYGTTNIPTSPLVPFISVKNSAAADKAIDVDLFQLHITGLSR